MLLYGIKDHYLIKLVSCLSGLYFSYKVWRYFLGNLNQANKNLKSIQCQSDFQNIKKNIVQFDNSTSEIKVLRGTVINGVIKKDSQNDDQSKNYIISKEGKKTDKLPYFQFADINDERMIVQFSNSCLIQQDLFKNTNLHTEDKYQKKIDLLGYSKLFSVQIQNFNQIMVESPLILFCDLIFNQKLDILRCHNVITMGTEKSIQHYFKKKIFQNILGMTITSFIIFNLLFLLKKIHKKTTQRKVNLEVVQISKGNETQICEQCKKNIINAIFFPCGHFNFCYDCGHLYKNCPHCEEEVEETIKVFKS